MSSVSRVVDAEVGGSSGGLDASRSIVVCRLAAAPGFARAGAFSPDGIALLGAPVFAVWMAAIGVALLRRPPEFVPARSDA